MKDFGCDKWQELLLDYRDGTLDEATAAGLRAHLAGCAACRAEFAWVSDTASALEALGDDIAGKAGGPDVRGAVMAAVNRQTGGHNVVSFGGESGRRSWRLAAAGLAAAAVVLVLAWVFGPWRAPETGGPAPRTVAQEPGAAVKPETAPVIKDGPDERVVAEDDEFERVRPFLNIPRGGQRTVKKGFEVAKEPDKGAVSLDEIIRARREEGYGGISQWASLSGEVAEEVAESSESDKARIGAAAFLPPDQAAAVLRSAVGNMPNDPYLRLAMSRAYDDAAAADPSAAGEYKQKSAANLATLRELDPGNALPLIQEGKALLEQGDVQAALKIFNTAMEQPRASTYSLESALFRSHALLEGGLDADAAELVSALYGGVDQYGYLSDLGRELLTYSQDYMVQGDYETARQLAQTVQRFGEQVGFGAEFTTERLAGLEIERMASDMLMQVYDGQGVTDPALDEYSVELTESFQEVLQLMDAFDHLLNTLPLEELLNLAGQILALGDLAVLSGSVPGQ